MIIVLRGRDLLGGRHHRGQRELCRDLPRVGALLLLGLRLRHARAMQDVQVKLAAFVASLSVLEAEKTLYEANAKKAAADMKLAIEERAATVLQAALVPEKILKLKAETTRHDSKMIQNGS